jgi:hypothetical protein
MRGKYTELETTEINEAGANDAAAEHQLFFLPEALPSDIGAQCFRGQGWVGCPPDLFNRHR